MFPVGLRLRLVVPLAWVLIAYGAFYTYFTTKTQRSEIMAEATVSTLRLANTVRRSTRYAMLQSRREDVHRMIEEIGQQPGMEHVRIFNKEGVIVYSSDGQEINRVVDRTAEGCNQCHDSEQPLTTLETPKRSRVYDSPGGYRTLAAIEVIYNEPSCWNAACHAHQQAQKLLGVIDVGVSLAGCGSARRTHHARHHHLGRHFHVRRVWLGDAAGAPTRESARATPAGEHAARGPGRPGRGHPGHQRRRDRAIDPLLCGDDRQAQDGTARTAGLDRRNSSRKSKARRATCKTPRLRSSAPKNSRPSACWRPAWLTN